jgi:FkbM family methyltransferase
VNQLTNRIKCFKLGIGSKKEERTFYLSDRSPAHSLVLEDKTTNKKITINCISLVDVFEDNSLDRCDILKMNCEGAEYEILYNTPKEYLAKVKRIRVDYHDFNPKDKHEELIKFLEKDGFTLIKQTTNSEKCGNIWMDRITS